MSEIPEFARYNFAVLEGADPADYLECCRCGCGERPRLTVDKDEHGEITCTAVCKWCGSGLRTESEYQTIVLWNERNGVE